LLTRSAIVEEQANIQLVEPTQVKITEKQTLIEDTPDSLLNAILEKDNELNRLLNEKEMLLSRLLNIPQDQAKHTPGHVTIFKRFTPTNLILFFFHFPINRLHLFKRRK